jgi:hypothetical protein
MDSSFIKIALTRLGMETVSRLKEQLYMDETIATGELANSITAKEVVGNALTITMDGYGGAIDEGIRKGGRPANGYRIKEWLKVKGIRLKDNTTGRYLKQTDYNYNKISFLISRSIAREGIIKRFGYKGSNFIDRAINNTLDEFDDAILEAFNKELTKEFDKIKTNG